MAKASWAAVAVVVELAAAGAAAGVVVGAAAVAVAGAAAGVEDGVAAWVVAVLVGVPGGAAVEQVSPCGSTRHAAAGYADSAGTMHMHGGQPTKLSLAQLPSAQGRSAVAAPQQIRPT